MATKNPMKSGGAKVAPARKTAPANTVDTAKQLKIKAAQKGGDVVFVRRKEMVERIVATSGLKPNAVKSVLDAVLQELGQALSNGENLNLHPLGKVTINRQKTVGDKEILVCKIRRKLPGAVALQTIQTAAKPAPGVT